MRNFFLFILFSFFFLSCLKEPEEEIAAGFFKLDPTHSHIDFSNQIFESDSLNYFNFPFLYLGGGVSVGDINNDGLPDIYFTGNQVPNKLYLNKGNLLFEDISESAGVTGDRRWYSGSTMVDINQDGWMDIYVSVGGVSNNTNNQLFINQQDGTFTEQAKAYGIADSSISTQSTFFDYDQDGLLDLFVANYPIVRVSAGNVYYKDKMEENKWEDSGHLYKNKGDGTFLEVSKIAGVQRFGLSLGVVASDFNQDGHTDLYLSNDFNVPDYMYQNLGDGTFAEISQIATEHTSMFGMGVDAADFNNDGWIDLFQLDMTAEDHFRSKTNMASMRPASFYEAVELGLHYQYMQNSLQLNNGLSPRGHPVFSDISRFAGMATTDWSWGTLFADLDNDGWKDVFVTNGIKRDVNNNDVNVKYETGTFWGWEEAPDYQLMPSTPISNYAFLNQQGLNFTNVIEEWGLQEKGFSHGFAVADLDNDGDLDIVINNMDASASLYINQAQQNDNHYLDLQFKGPPNNPLGLGTRVTVHTNSLSQVQELTLTRGYLSSVEPRMHFGLGQEDIIELIIRWPDGAVETIDGPAPNQTVQVDYMDASITDEKTYGPDNQLVEDFTLNSGITFQHQEDAFDDFLIEPLLPHKNSQMGPGIAVGDVNQDGYEDFFVGNAAGKPGAMYYQDTSGSFSLVKGPWEKDSSYEDTGALLFDADLDSDLDLYVVNGGNDSGKPKAFYQDRLYIQTEEGFAKSEQALPILTVSGRVVKAGDFDADGDPDLFIGGRVVPGKYPLAAPSYLLRNEGGQDQSLRFEEVTEAQAPELYSTGLVSSALWEDFDQDGKLDLILAGEWMPIRFFKNMGTHFEEKTQDLGSNEKTGWWYSLQAADLDQDGDMDFLAGNLGLNYKYQASTKAPFQLFANDFDENSRLDIVLSYDKKGKLLPVRGRECSSEQVPALATRFKTFEAFAQADLEELYGTNMLDASLHLEANTFASYWIENKGGERFEWHLLPDKAQLSSINAIEVFDYNQDSFPDVFLFGNLYTSEVETPRSDAGIGLVLRGNARTEFEPVSPMESGIFVRGAVNDLGLIRLGQAQRPAFLVARNNESLKLLQLR
ncbi:MAG: VCBS repeat-containing protein [Bacteroidota bacterium]